MGRELRAYRIIDDVMRLTNNQADYGQAKQKAFEYCQKARPDIFNFTDVSHDYEAAKRIATVLTGHKFW